MATHSPPSLSESQLLERQNRIANIAEALGFGGNVEYRHVYSQTGGAQYGRGCKESEDLLIVSAEAFERDADPEDFSLEAMIAHERGHQILARHRQLAKRVIGISVASEEILASLVGAMICYNDVDRDTLYAKAFTDLLGFGQTPESATRQLQDLWELLEEYL